MNGVAVMNIALGVVQTANCYANMSMRGNHMKQWIEAAICVLSTVIIAFSVSMFVFDVSKDAMISEIEAIQAYPLPLQEYEI